MTKQKTYTIKIYIKDKEVASEVVAEVGIKPFIEELVRAIIILRGFHVPISIEVIDNSTGEAIFWL